MYPEAGGSSSFARRAFNEFWSFFAAWAQMLTYVATIATSRVLRPALPRRPVLGRRCATRPGDIIFALRHDRDPRRDQHRRRQGVDRRQRPARGRRLPHPGAAGADRRRSSCSRRRSWSTTSTSGIAPTWTNFVLAIPIGMLAYTGIETVSNMSEEAKDEAHDDPGGDRPRAARRVRDLLHAARRRAVGAAGDAASTASTRRCSGVPDEQGGYAGDPVLGVVTPARPRPAPAPGGDLRRPARRDDPLPGHQRGPDRHLAARLLDGHPPPDARRAAAPAPEVPHAVDRDHRLLRLRDPRHAAGQGDVPRQRLLVRRAAVVHDGARLGRPAALRPSRTSRGPTGARATSMSRGVDLPLFAIVGGIFTAIAFVVDRRAEPGRGGRSASAGWCSGSSSTSSSGAARGST